MGPDVVQWHFACYQHRKLLVIWRTHRMSQRNATALVQLKVRMRESLRKNLEKAATERNISLNQEINDRLERSEERYRLLPEALSLAFGPRTAGILLMLGIALDDAGTWFMDSTRTVAWNHDLHWSDHPDGFDCAFLAVLDLLLAVRPTRSSSQKIDAKAWAKMQSISASVPTTLVRDILGEDVSPLTGAPPWCDADTIRNLLGSAFAAKLKRWGVDEAEQARRLIETMLSGGEDPNSETSV